MIEHLDFLVWLQLIVVSTVEDLSEKEGVLDDNLFLHGVDDQSFRVFDSFEESILFFLDNIEFQILDFIGLKRIS